LHTVLVCRPPAASEMGRDVMGGSLTETIHLRWQYERGGCYHDLDLGFLSQVLVADAVLPLVKRRWGYDGVFGDSNFHYTSSLQHYHSDCLAFEQSLPTASPYPARAVR
jgi:hypothetical protein